MYGQNVGRSSNMALVHTSSRRGILMRYSGLLHLIVIGTIVLPVLAERHENDELTRWACGWQGVKPAKVTPPAVLTSPLYPNGTYMLNENCHWLITSSPGMVIQLTFTNFDLEPIYECIYAYVEVHDGDEMNDDNFVKKFCGQTVPNATHTSTHNMYMEFSSASQGDGTGFVAYVDYIPVNSIACSDDGPAVITWSQGGFVSPQWPNKYPSDTICRWRIETDQDVRLEFVEWSLRPPEDHECLDHVSLYDGPNPSSPALGSYCGDMKPMVAGKSSTSLLIEFHALDLFESFTGKFHAKFRTMNLTETACSGNKLADIDWSPGYIRGPLTESSQCAWRFMAPEGMVIRFEIEYFELPDCSNCGCASVDIYNGEYADPQKMIGSYCHYGWAEDFIQSGGNTARTVYTNYLLDGHKGFSIRFTFYDFSVQACGGLRPIVLSHDYGIIASPGYNRGRYPNDAWCEWAVEAELGQVVEVHFLTLELEACPACMCDVLYTYNGPLPEPDREVRESCDYKPTTFLSSLPGIFLRFLTNEENAFSGFKMEYEIYNLSDIACGLSRPAELSMEPGDIFSPNFENGIYPLATACTWLLSSVYEKRVQLSFEHFNIEYDIPERCMFDRLTVYDGDLTTAPVLGTYCGNTAPDHVTSTQRYMLVEFYSNYEIAVGSFHLSFKHVDPGPGKSDASVLVPVIICSILAASIIVVGIVMYCKRSKHFKRCQREPAEPPRPPLRLDNIPSRPTGRPSEPSVQTRPRSRAHPADIYQYQRQTAGARRHSSRPPSFSDGSSQQMIQPPSYQNIDDFPHNQAMNDFPPPSYQESLGHRLAHSVHLSIESSFMSTTNSANQESQLNITHLTEDPSMLPSWNLHESGSRAEFNSSFPAQALNQGFVSDEVSLDVLEEVPNVRIRSSSTNRASASRPDRTPVATSSSRELVSKTQSREALSGSGCDSDSPSNRNRLLQLRRSMEQLDKITPLVEDKITPLAEDTASTSEVVLRQKKQPASIALSPAKRLSKSYDNILFTKDSLRDIADISHNENIKLNKSMAVYEPVSRGAEPRRRSKSESNFPASLSVAGQVRASSKDSTLTASHTESCV